MDNLDVNSMTFRNIPNNHIRFQILLQVLEHLVCYLRHLNFFVCTMFEDFQLLFVVVLLSKQQYYLILKYSLSFELE